MKSTQNKKKDIKLGDTDLLASDEFDSKYGKERITLCLDQQVVGAFRELAKAKGEKYQTLIRESLRDLVFHSEESALEKRVSKIEKVFLKKEA